jgi:pimeloyl-ACP methyl ester carboxylesterase
MTQTTHTLAVPGARLHYEVRGAGPVVAVIGSPMAASEFAALADALADTHTVITYDPRGISASLVEDPTQDSIPELRGDDVVAILDAVGADCADVFGSSGGAVTGLALVTRHPERVRMLVAHEPPLLELLPDAAEQRARIDDIVETFHAHGVGAAWMEFMTNAGFDIGEGGAPAMGEPSAQDLANSARFFDHELRPTTRYVPDISALAASPARIIVGVGVESGHLVTHRTSTVLASRLGTVPVEFPGDHGGFLSAPEKFAARLTEVLGR